MGRGSAIATHVTNWKQPGTNARTRLRETSLLSFNSLAWLFCDTAVFTQCNRQCGIFSARFICETILSRFGAHIAYGAMQRPIPATLSCRWHAFRYPSLRERRHRHAPASLRPSTRERVLRGAPARSLASREIVVGRGIDRRRDTVGRDCAADTCTDTRARAGRGRSPEHPPAASAAFGRRRERSATRITHLSGLCSVPRRALV